MRLPNGRFSDNEMNQFVKIFECAITFVKREGYKTYQIALKKNRMKIIAEFIGDAIKGYKLRLMP